MRLSFFRALDPTSKRSSVTYVQGGNFGQEIIDNTVSENIGIQFKDKLNFIHKLCAISHVILGEHFVLNGESFDFNNRLSDYDGWVRTTGTEIIWERGKEFITGARSSKNGSKGMLDYLFFPLVARKIIFDHGFLTSEELEQGSFSSLLFSGFLLGVAFELEMIRLAVGYILTLLAVPLVLIAHFVEACFNQEENDQLNITPF